MPNYYYVIILAQSYKNHTSSTFPLRLHRWNLTFLIMLTVVLWAYFINRVLAM